MFRCRGQWGPVGLLMGWLEPAKGSSVKRMRAVNAKHGAGDNKFGVMVREERDQGAAIQRRALSEMGSLEG